MRKFPIDILPCMRLISSFVISVVDYLSFSFSAKIYYFKKSAKKKYFEIFLTLTSGEDIVIPKLIGSNSESSLSKPSIGLVCYKCKVVCVLMSFPCPMRSSGEWNIWKTHATLRVVQTKSILFLKSMSERVGSDIQRLWNWMMNFLIDSTSIEDDVIKIQSRSMSDPTLSDILFKNKMDLVWTTLNRVPQMIFTQKVQTQT